MRPNKIFTFIAVGIVFLAGTNLFAKRTKDRDLLYYARTNNLPKVKDSIENKKATVDAQHKTGERLTPLIHAVKNKNLDMVTYLVETTNDKKKKKANVNKKDFDGLTPLHYAVMAGDKKIVEFLLKKENNADPIAKDFMGKTPLCFTVRNFNPEEVKLLKEEKPVEIVEIAKLIEDTEIPENSRKKEIKALRKKKVKEKDDDELKPSEARDKEGFAPLHRAAQRGFTRAMKALLDAGADINILSTKDKQTPLHEAAIHGYLRSVKTLVNEGAEPDLENKSGLTPRGYAEAGGKNREKIADLLEEQGAVLTEKDKKHIEKKKKEREKK